MIRPITQALAAPVLIGAVACGARTTLDVPGAQVATCSPPTPPASPCTAWTTAGATREISDGPTRLAYSYAAMATGCNVLVAWAKLTSSLQFATSVVAWDGSTTSLVAHPALSANGIVPGDWELAENHGTFGGLTVVNQGDPPGFTRFVRLDGGGAEQSAPIALDPKCAGLAPVDDEFSCLGEHTNGPVTLDQIHTDGSSTSTVLPQGHQGFANRLVYDDGSFLLHTFVDSGADDQQHWLRHFDAHGVALAPEVALTNDQLTMFGVHLAETTTGVIAAWGADGAVHGLALDRDGNVTSSLQTLAQALAPSWLGRANGDVVIVWNDSAEQMFVQVLAPDATPRGGATKLLTDAIDVQQPQIVVEPNGQRALFLYIDATSRIAAQPLRCANRE